MAKVYIWMHDNGFKEENIEKIFSTFDAACAAIVARCKEEEEEYGSEYFKSGDDTWYLNSEPHYVKEYELNE